MNNFEQQLKNSFDLPRRSRTGRRTLIPLAALLCLGFLPAGAARGEYDPLRIEGCVLWLDGRDAESIQLDVNGRVLRWMDKSGHRNHFEQTHAATRPHPAKAGSGDHSGLRFSGDEWLERPQIEQLHAGQRHINMTVMVVFETVEEHPIA